MKIKNILDEAKIDVQFVEIKNNNFTMENCLSRWIFLDTTPACIAITFHTTFWGKYKGGVTPKPFTVTS